MAKEQEEIREDNQDLNGSEAVTDVADVSTGEGQVADGDVQDVPPAPSRRGELMELLQDEIPGYDTEDQEAGYGQLIDYLKSHREERERLADVLQQDPRMAQLLVDVISGKRGAAGALARYYGKDFLSAEEGSAEYEEIQRGEEERKQELESIRSSSAAYQSNLDRTLPEVESYCEEKGLDIEEFLHNAWEHIVKPIMEGNYSKDVCAYLDKGLSYDKDTADALAAGRVQGRNENISSLQRERETGDGLPKGLSSQPAGDAPKRGGYTLLDLAKQA